MYALHTVPISSPHQSITVLKIEGECILSSVHPSTTHMPTPKFHMYKLNINSSVSTHST